jgi:hypothetical protein
MPAEYIERGVEALRVPSGSDPDDTLAASIGMFRL